MGKTKALAAVKECLGLPEDAQSMQILNAAGRTQVVDMFGDDKLSAKIQIRPMGQLLRGVDQMLVVRYTWDDDSPMWRELSCAFAIAIAKDKRPQQMYHLLGNNCEQFATFCRTFRWESKQVKEVFKVIEEKLLPVVWRYSTTCEDYYQSPLGTYE